MAIKKLFLLLGLSASLMLLPLSAFADPAPNGFSVTGTYKFVASTPSGLSGTGYLVYTAEVNNRPTTIQWSIPQSAHWENTMTVGKTYTCAGSGTKDNPTNVSCRLSQATDTPGTTDSNDPAPTPSTDPATDGGTTEEVKDSKPLSATIPGGQSTVPKIAATKNCPSDVEGTTYKSGLLKGVVCAGATKSIDTIVTVVRNIITMVLLPLAGIIFTLMFVIGGLIYITSAGNEKRIELAKKTLTAAVIGLLIVVLSFALIRIFVSVLGGGVTTT